MSEQHQRALGLRALLASIAIAFAMARLARAAVSAVAVDVAALAGAGLIVYGIRLWSVPAAYIVAGLFLLGAAVRYSRANAT